MGPQVRTDEQVRATATQPPLFDEQTLKGLEKDFLEGLETLDRLAVQQVDPFELVRGEAPKLAQMLRQMAGVEPNQAFTAQIDQTADRLMTDLEQTGRALREEIAALKETPSRAITDMLVQLAIMSSTGHIAPEDYQMLVGVLATQQERIAQDMIRSYDDRIRKIESESLEWYRRYNLAKSQQNAPFVQFAMESLRSGTRLTKMHMDQMNAVYDRHLRLTRLRLDALSRGSNIALERDKQRQALTNEWMRLAIQVGRFTSTLDDADPNSQATRRRYWTLFAQHTERLREAARQQGLGDLYPEITDGDIATLSMAVNPNVYLTQIMTQRGAVDMVNLQYQALRNRAEIERISQEIVLGGNYDRIQRDLESEVARLRTTQYTNLANAFAAGQNIYAGYLALGEVAYSQFAQFDPSISTGAQMPAPGRRPRGFPASVPGGSVNTGPQMYQTTRNNIREANRSATLFLWSNALRVTNTQNMEAVQALSSFRAFEALATAQQGQTQAQQGQTGSGQPNPTLQDTYTNLLKLRTAYRTSNIQEANQTAQASLQAIIDDPSRAQALQGLKFYTPYLLDAAERHKQLAIRLNQAARSKGINTGETDDQAGERAYAETIRAFIDHYFER